MLRAGFNLERQALIRYFNRINMNKDKLVNGDKLLHLEVVFVAAGIRREMDKKDVYRVAQKLVESVLPELSEYIDEVELKEKD